MTVLAYAVVAAAVIFFAVRCAHYVDLLEEMTPLSGAFIGGVILAAVTSLPELFTSLSATLFLSKPELVLGNILGSDLFNLAVLAVLVLCFLRRFASAPVDRSHRSATLYALICYLLLTVTVLSGWETAISTVSVPSLFLALFYGLSIRRMSGGEKAGAPKAKASRLPLGAVVLRFSAAAAGLVLASIAITFITDRLAGEFGLGATFAGALFLGVATSLPEVSSTAALFRSGNINAAVGNITGSNIFNFFILFLADLSYLRGSIYVRDQQTGSLLLFGAAAELLTLFLVVPKGRAERAGTARYAAVSVGVAFCYLAFLLTPAGS